MACISPLPVTFPLRLWLTGCWLWFTVACLSGASVRDLGIYICTGYSTVKTVTFSVSVTRLLLTPTLTLNDPLSQNFTVVATFTPRSSHISKTRFTHSLLLASSLAAGRRSAPRKRAMAGLLLFVDSLLNRCYLLVSAKFHHEMAQTFKKHR